MQPTAAEGPSRSSSLDDQAHTGHEMCREWMESIGEVDYDPARFELDEINKVFASHAASAPQQ